MGTPMQKRYQSRIATFYEEIQQFVGPKASFVRPLSKGSPLMYSGEQSEFIISKTRTNILSNMDCLHCSQQIQNQLKMEDDCK